MSDNYLYDPAGFPIEKDRPIVFDEGGLEPHTELSITERAQDLGLPGEGFYNVPSIYEGKIYNPKNEFDAIRQNVQKMYESGFKFPSYSTSEEAVKAAEARSRYIGEIRRQELESAIENQRQQIIIDLMRRHGVMP